MFMLNTGTSRGGGRDELTFPTASPMRIFMSISMSSLMLESSSGDEGSTIAGRIVVAADAGIPENGDDPGL